MGGCLGKLKGEGAASAGPGVPPAASGTASGPQTDAGGATIEDLPDPCLNRILLAAGIADNPSLSRVCRRWRRLYLTEPSLWSSFPLNASARSWPGTGGNAAEGGASWLERMAARLHLLSTVSPLVRSVHLRDSRRRRQVAPTRVLRDALCRLHPHAVAAVTVHTRFQPPPELLQQLLCFTGLTSLELSSGGLLPSGTPAVLAALPRLQALACRWHEGAAAPGLCAAAAGLPQLTRLHLELSSFPQFATGGSSIGAQFLAELAQALLALRSSLRDLRCHITPSLSPAASQPELHLDSSEREDVLAGLAACSQLTQLQLHLDGLPPHALEQLSSSLGALRRLVVREVCGHRPSLRLPALSRWPLLQSCEVAASVLAQGGGPGCLEAPGGSSLQQVRLHVTAAAAVDGMPAAAELTLAGLAGCRDLQELLGSLLPGGAVLARLAIVNAELNAEAVQECSQLASLCSLRLSRIPGSPDHVWRLLRTILQQARQLAELCLEWGHWHLSWEGIDCLPELRRLVLLGTSPNARPPFDVLPGLEELMMCRMHVDKQRIEALLPSMPRLRRLVLPRDGLYHQHQADLLKRLPGLLINWNPEESLNRLAPKPGELINIALLGTSGAGKTTLLRHGFWFGPMRTHQWRGCTVETVEWANIRITSWDTDGSDRIRPMPFSEVGSNIRGIIYVLDSSDRAQVWEAASDLGRLLHKGAEGKLWGVPLLVLANKHDRDGRAICSAEEVESLLALQLCLDTRPWRVQACCGGGARGLFDGLEWLGEQMAACAALGGHGRPAGTLA